MNYNKYLKTEGFIKNTLDKISKNRESKKINVDIACKL